MDIHDNVQILEIISEAAHTFSMTTVHKAAEISITT
jgi:hypothetical protein